ncbi:MAG: DNA polymerase III subunit gamma/tau, partial [Propionibacteriaceae bacterium]|nr:DNA polymerase III subunit gamma/tau [Propionibacteriaceae bacterium]
MTGADPTDEPAADLPVADINSTGADPAADNPTPDLATASAEPTTDTLVTDNVTVGAKPPDDAKPTADLPVVDLPLAAASAGPAATARGPASPAAEPPLALSRRYRPDRFADVIGQEHVTEPLRRALANNRVNHAYLFSGPRGCGKTSSARILARALNCRQGPTPEPCGECDSCRDLATGGNGSIDVIEIDAASHGGVDDARDLRERAFFAPVQSRYKVYIVDEAHMVTTQGFNALLKLVEEPPPHVKFIFATTEPDKVIGTIRSRTHHYPFRLVPPRLLGDYLNQICQRERVVVEPGVVPLVVRAGAGSVRDALSVLDQLLGAAGVDGVGYAQASALLGYTPDSLLDEFVDALAAGDAHGVFATVDKV